MDDLAENDFDWLDSILGIPTDSEPTRHLCQPSIEDPRFMAPLKPRAAAATFLTKYDDDKSLTQKAKVAAAVLSARLGVADKLLSLKGAGQILPLRRWPLLDQLEQELGEPELLAAITIGGRRRNRKPVIHLVTPDGRSVGFAKVGWSPLTNTLVTNEAKLLRSMEGHDPKIQVPTVISEFDWFSGSVVVSSAMPISPRAKRSKVFDDEMFKAIASAVPNETKRFEDIDFSDLSESLAGKVDLARLQTEYSGQEIAFGAWHGDLTPWNTCTVADTTAIWDWEFGSTSAPIGFDQLHCQFEIFRRAPQNTSSEALEQTHARASEILNALDQPSEAVFALYLLELARRELQLEGQLFENLEMQLMPQLILMFRKLGFAAD